MGGWHSPMKGGVAMGYILKIVLLILVFLIVFAIKAN